jgi:hypothetical protein
MRPMRGQNATGRYWETLELGNWEIAVIILECSDMTYPRTQISHFPNFKIPKFMGLSIYKFAI